MTQGSLDSARRFIGYTWEVRAPEPVTVSEVRRFVQAVMDPDPLYYDEAYARGTRYGGVVCPPLFPLNAFRTPPGPHDPLTEGFRTDADFDGLVREEGFPDLPLPFKRVLNAGTEVEVYALARPGDRLVARNRILDIQEKQGRSGPFVLVTVESQVFTEEGTLLLVARYSRVYR